MDILRHFFTGLSPCGHFAPVRFHNIALLMHIDREHRRGRFVVSGRLLPEEVAELAVGALGAAAAEGLRTLILQFKDLSLTRSLSILESQGVGERLALAGAGLAKVAVVIRNDCVAAHAFLLTVATSRGLRAATFQAESEALSWLQAPR